MVPLRQGIMFSVEIQIHFMQLPLREGLQWKSFL